MIRLESFSNNGLANNQYLEFDEADSDFVYVGIDPVIPFYKKIKSRKKIYKSTQKIRELLEEHRYSGLADLSSYDLCPSVTIWIGTGEVEGTNEKSLYFNVENSTVIKQIADYYELEFPVDKEFINTLHNSPETISFYSLPYKEIVVGSVKFIDGQPTEFKVYALYKEKGKYMADKLCRVFSNQEIVETGGLYIATDEDFIYESEGKGFKVEHTVEDKDPLLPFKSVITYNDGTVCTKYYESSNMFRAALLRVTSGTNYPGYNKAPHVKWWLGRSWLENNTEEELYFHAESKETLDNICLYYGLPVPYDEEVGRVLKENPKKIRFRSYDLENLGPGKFVEVILCSVVFHNKVPVGIKLYEVTRAYE